MRRTSALPSEIDLAPAYRGSVLDEGVSHLAKGLKNHRSRLMQFDLERDQVMMGLAYDERSGGYIIFNPLNDLSGQEKHLWHQS